MQTGKCSTNYEDPTVQKIAYAFPNRFILSCFNRAVYRPGLAKFTPQNINPKLCTHIIYAFGGLSSKYEMKAFDAYNDINQGKRFLKKKSCLCKIIFLFFLFKSVAQSKRLNSEMF